MFIHGEDMLDVLHFSFKMSFYISYVHMICIKNVLLVSGMAVVFCCFMDT